MADPPEQPDRRPADIPPPAPQARGPLVFDQGTGASIGLAVALIGVIGVVQVAALLLFGALLGQEVVEGDEFDPGLLLLATAALGLVALAAIPVVSSIAFGPRIGRDLRGRTSREHQLRATGIVADRAARRAAWRALLPLLGLLLAPSVISVIAAGDPIPAAGLGGREIGVLLALAIAIGWTEELWFRGLLPLVLGGPRHPVRTTVVGALAFGVLHVPLASPTEEPAMLLNAVGVTIAVGVPFMLIRLRTAALAPLAWAHGLIDAWAFIATGAVVAQGEPRLGDAIAVVVMAVLVAAGYVWWYRRGGPVDEAAWVDARASSSAPAGR